MSDIMRPIPFGELMNWVLEEYRTEGTIFGVNELYRHTSGKTLPIFTEQVETPFGPAAGPHTQLAQNLIAAYVGGSRFFEVKTVQIIDGEDLPVAKPCIKAEDECYNVEWSTELRVPQAYEEYIKAWLAIKLLSESMGFGSPDGFVFNMSVGYDLAGIKSEKVDKYIEGMKDASASAVWAECTAWAKENLDRLPGIDAAYPDAGHGEQRHHGFSDRRKLLSHRAAVSGPDRCFEPHRRYGDAAADHFGYGVQQDRGIRSDDV